jgi:UDP-N-acetylglucosamine acyltransferase
MKTQVPGTGPGSGQRVISMADIHPTAIVDSSARIAESAHVGPYCVIGPEVVIGARTRLLNHVTIQALTEIGEDNALHPYSVIGADPQDRKFKGERATCVIGDRNMIREHVTIHRGTANGGGRTTIGDDNLIMVAAHIAHDCHVAHNVCIANQVMLAGHVRVEEHANIGGGAGLHHFTTVGAYSFVGGMARIPKDVPPFMIVEGNPAEVRAINSIAMSRNGFRPEHVDAVKDAFKRLYRENGAAMSDKIETLRHEYRDVPAVCRLCRFLAASAEGVHGRAAEVVRGDDKRTLPVSTTRVGAAART